MTRATSLLANALKALLLLLVGGVLVVLAINMTVFSIGWMDKRGDEFVAKRLRAQIERQNVQSPSDAAPKIVPSRPQRVEEAQLRAVEEAQLRANAYSAAASYLNFNYSIPLSLVIALLGALGTLAGVVLGWRLTNRQGDVEILKFIEEKIRPTIQHQRRLADFLVRLMQWGNKTRAFSDVLKDRIEREGGPSVSPLFLALRTIDEALDKELPTGPVLSALESDLKTLAQQSLDFISHLNALADELQDIFQSIIDDAYSFFFFRLQADKVEKKLRPLDFLARQLPDTMAYYPLAFGSALPDLALNLSYFAKATRPTELVKAAYSLPADNLTLEYIGHVIFSLRATPYRLAESGNALTARYYYNFGAAYLITLIQAMPSKRSMVAGFRRMFGNRSAVAESFIEATVPEMNQMGPTAIIDSIRKSLVAPSRLITAEVLTDGPTKAAARAEYYQSWRHGPLFQRFDKADSQEKGAALASRALFNSNLG